MPEVNCSKIWFQIGVRFFRVVSSLCHTPIHTVCPKTQFQKSESAHSVFEEITVAVSLFPFVPYSLFLAREKLELAPGRGIYAEANLCSFVAARAEMGAAVGCAA
jgi:hypothetical protein